MAPPRWQPVGAKTGKRQNAFCHCRSRYASHAVCLLKSLLTCVIGSGCDETNIYSRYKASTRTRMSFCCLLQLPCPVLLVICFPTFRGFVHSCQTFISHSSLRACLHNRTPNPPPAVVSELYQGLIQPWLEHLGLPQRPFSFMS